MTDRKGEKIGWTAGWSGGFIWVVILSVMFFFQGKMIQCFTGLALCAAAFALIVLCAPWCHQTTAYWKLMIPIYALFFLTFGWAVWAFGGLEGSGLHWWCLLWVLPALIPLGTLGRKTWSSDDGHTDRVC
jgi:Na+-driven multidrug efflux pump